MMIKANGEFLDFNDDIEVESQIKLFEEIDSSHGDWSYAFDLTKSNHNLKVLGLPFPDTVKSIYQNVPAEIIDDSGFRVYTGSIKVERVTDVISCSFFSGNNDWFGLLNDPLSSLPLYRYDQNLTYLNIQSSWSNTKELIFPIIDTGALLTRSYRSLKLEDFSACFYVKTLFNEIFAPKGIKLEGDLMDDDTFNKLIITANSRSKDEVTARSSYVKKTSAQAGISSLTKITFQDETTYPFFDGAQGNFTSSTYTADVKMTVDVELSLNILFLPLTYGYVRVRINGANYKRYNVDSGVGGGLLTFTKTLKSIDLEAGDYIEIYADFNSGVSFTVSSGTIKVTPTFIYRVFGKSSVPDWTQGELVSNILRGFNVLPSYNTDNKTLTLDLFNKIKSKPEIDVSDSITITETDYSDFVSSYAQRNFFKYQEGSDEDLREYNISNFVKYGSGTVDVNNDFIESSKDIVESDFTSPITYLNGVFDCSLERINYVELEEIDDGVITAVTDVLGTPRFSIVNADTLFSIGDLVRIETDIDSYNGEWVIAGVSTTYITVTGPTFDSTATGTATLLKHKFTTEDDVFLFINVANAQCLFFSSNYTMSLADSSSGQIPFTSASLAYFNLLSNGREINTKFKQSLSFGEINDPLSYQRTVIQTYWPIFTSILNDPVMIRVAAYFNKKTYLELNTFLRPLRIKTNETSNLYYLNRITGYKGGDRACEAELIKL